MAAPEGAQLSDDGQWWWDGSQWQPVDSGGQDASAAGSGDYQSALASLGVSSVDELRSAHNAQPYEEDTDPSSGTTDVLAFADTGNESGESIA